VSGGTTDEFQASLSTLVSQRIAAGGGWLPFDQFMALALYAPGQGYYARGDRQFGLMPGRQGQQGSDFVTAPELSPLFGAALARQVAQALDAAQADTVWEFGAGSGALAEQLLDALDALGTRIRCYAIVDISGALRARQARRLARFGSRVQWLDALPETLHGVLLGNEVLDAMPVHLLHWDGRNWLERGVSRPDGGVGGSVSGNASDRFIWADRPTTLRPPVPAGHFPPGTVTELHLQAQAFIRTLADRLQRGAAFFIDYGFPEAEYYHPQRHQGTLMCHRAHMADTDPLTDVGDKDITTHIDFSAIALAAQDAGLEVAGYTTQAHLLMNCGLLDLLQHANLRTRANAQKLLTEHEMGELFKAIALTKNLPGFRPLGFAAGDRTHTL
jgi:SAM-dependent MidA family methyltransferase